MVACKVLKGFKLALGELLEGVVFLVSARLDHSDCRVHCLGDQVATFPDRVDDAHGGLRPEPLER